MSPISSDNRLSEKRVTLLTKCFQRAVEHHLDESKPDPLAKQQVESWQCEWTNNESLTRRKADSSEESFPIDGCLHIYYEYIVVTLKAVCSWDWSKECQRGRLHFILEASGRFRSQSEPFQKSDPVEGIADGAKKSTRGSIRNQKEGSGSSGKILASVISKLREDDYIKKLMPTRRSTDRNASPNAFPGGMVCEAVVFVDNETSRKLEERVDVDDDMVEGIRRSIYSQADSTLSVFDLLMSLPYLSTPDCPLGLRAKLRLLEDSMLDACDKEEEEELLGGLSIAPNYVDKVSDCDKSNNVEKDTWQRRHKRAKR